GPWIRPLLEASRADIEADLRAIGQAWREDGSNRDPSYSRNRVRLEVVPRLVSIASGAARDSVPDLEKRGALAKRGADTLREVRRANRAFERRAERVLLDSALPDGTGVALDCSRLARQPEPIVGLVIQKAWGSLGLDKDLTRPALRAIV